MRSSPVKIPRSAVRAGAVLSGWIPWEKTIPKMCCSLFSRARSGIRPGRKTGQPGAGEGQPAGGHSEKLLEGKGAGYARWARSFNLKQLAQTMNFLTDHNLLEYAALAEKTADATAHYNALSDQIKAAEKRMAEIAVLKTHIINYSKTRDVYVAYRKAGYSKNFWRSMRLTFCSIRRRRKPLTSWG